MRTVNSRGWDPIRIFPTPLACPGLANGDAIPGRIPSSRNTVVELAAPSAFRQGRIKCLLVADHYAEAVRNASLTVLKARRARGESTHPFYWAGFVAAGDWR